MDKSHAQAHETRKRNEQHRRERREWEQAEIKTQAAALRQIRDSQEAVPETRLEAVKLLLELERKGYI